MRLPEPKVKLAGRRAAQWSLSASALFACMNLFAREGSQRLNWSQVAASRTMVSLFITLVLVRARRIPLRFQHPRLMWSRSAFGTLALLCTFWTLASHIALGDLVTLFSTSAVFIALLSPRLLNEKTSGLTWVAIAVALGGVAMLSNTTFNVQPAAAAVALCAAFFSACAMISLRAIVRSLPAASGAEALVGSEDPSLIVLHFSAVATVVSASIAVFSWKTPTAREASWLLLAGVAGGLGQLTMTRAYQLDRAARISVLSYSSIVFTHGFSALAYGTVPTPKQIAGALLVIVAGSMLALRSGSG